MARKLNIRLLKYLVIFGAPVLVVIVLLALHARRPGGLLGGGDPKQALQQAEACIRRERWPEALAAIRRAAQLDPQNADLRRRVGWVALRQDPPAVAVARRAFEGTVALRPDDPDIQRDLAELYVLPPVRLRGRLEGKDTRDLPLEVLYALSARYGLWRPSPEVALREIDRLLELKPDDGGGHLWGAMVNMLRGDAEPLQRNRTPHYEEAVRRCQAGLQRAPQTVDLYRLLAQAYAKLGQQENVGPVLDAAVQHNPQSPQAYLLKAGFLLSSGKEAEAAEALEQGLKKAGETAELYFALGEIAVRRRQPEAARPYLEKGLALDPTQETGYRQLALLYRMENASAKAIDILQKGLQALPDALALQAELADLFLEGRQREPADALIQTIVAAHPDSGEANLLRGKRAMMDRQVRQAVTYLRQARAALPTPQVRLLLARAYTLAGELGAARQEVAELLTIVPGLVPARRLLAEIQLRLREPDEAVHAAAAVLKAEPDDVEMRLLMAQALTALRRHGEALEHALAAAARAKDDPMPLLVAATIQQRMRHNREAEDLLLKAKALGKRLDQVYEALIRLYRSTDQHEKAEAAIQEARTAAPEAVFAAGGQSAKALQGWLTQRVQEDPSPRNKLALASVLLATEDQRERGLALIETVLGEADPHSADWRNAWQAAFLQRLMAGAYDDATRLVDRLRQVNPDAPELQFTEALVALRQNRVAEATDRMRTVVANNPTSASLFLLGQLLMQQQKFTEAREALQRAVDLRPDLVQARLVLGRMHLAQGNYAGALLEAREALNFVPRSFPVLDLKASACAGQADWDEAIATREEIANLAPDHVGNLVALASLYVHRGKPREAEEKFKAAYQQAPDNPAVVMALAEFYGRTGRRPEGEAILDQYLEARRGQAEPLLMRADFTARFVGVQPSERYYREAFQTEPGDPRALIRLGDQYSREKEWDKAEAIYREVVSQFPANTTARKRLADAYMLQGKLDQAQTIIRDCLAADPRDAQALVVRGRIAARRQNFDEARRYMTSALEIAPNYGEARFWLAALQASSDPLTALGILDQIEPSDGAFEKGMLLRSSISTRRGQLSQAILDLRRLLDFRPTSVLGRRVLAERYMAAGDYAKASDLLAQLVREERDPDLSVRFGDALFRENRYAEALRQYEQARAMRPESADALVGEARCLVALNRIQEAITRIQKVMGDFYGEAWPRLALVAVYEATGQLDKAIEALATGRIQKPTWEEGYVREAQIVARAAEKAAPPERDRLLAHSHQVLVEGLKRVDRSIAIRTALGAMEVERGRYDAAIEVLGFVAEEFQKSYSRLPEDLPGLRPYVDGVRMVGLALYYQGRVDEAIRWSRMVWDLDPAEVANANNLAWMLATEKKQYEEATQIIRMVLRLIPENAQVLDTAGWIAHLKGDYAEAARQFQRSIERHDNPEARYHLGRTYEAWGRPEDARIEYQKALDLGLKGKDRQDAERRLRALALGVSAQESGV
jgi:tetratricopeptide (TPR) repeat protein